MSYADRLQKLVEYQTNIRSALEAKGATISSDATLKDFPSAVDTITGDYTGPTPADFVENGMGAYASMMSNATKIASYAFCSNRDITEANFPRVSTIGESAFYYARNLSNIYFPNVTSIDHAAFAFCDNISIISFPKCGWLGRQAFSSCTRATTVSLPELTGGDTNGWFFGNCSLLTVVNLPKYNASGTNALFSGCKNLEEASLPSLDGILGFYTFNNCYKLREVYTPLATGVQSACFSNCSTLTTLSFPNLQTINASAFVYATALTKLYILSDTMVKLSASNAFNYSPISKSTYTGSFGSVFVKYNLLDRYKSSTNWVTYADRLAAEVPFSATNLSESDSITAFVEGKESPIPLEVSSTEFTYSVYSKYPKYTGTQADMNENGEINISLPTDGVTLTVNTTPEDATVRITEDGIADTYTKTKILNSGDTVDYMVYKDADETNPCYYIEKHNTISVEQDTEIDVILEGRYIDTVTLPEITHHPEKYADVFGDNMFEVYNTTQLRTTEGTGKPKVSLMKYFIYNTLPINSRFKAKVKRSAASYEGSWNIGMDFTINKVLDTNTYEITDLQKPLPLTEDRIYAIYLEKPDLEYDIDVELEPNTTYYIQFLARCYDSTYGSGSYGYITDMTLYYDGGPVE